MFAVAHDEWTARGYEPPYESPLEDDFAYEVTKHLRLGRSGIQAQVPLGTIGGLFRADFLLKSPRGDIVVECDGREFHDPYADEWRDAMLLGSRLATAVYRFPGKMIFHRLADCLQLLSYFEPQLFHERGRRNVYQLSSWKVRDAEFDSEQEKIAIVAHEASEEERYEGERNRWFQATRRHAGPHRQFVPQWKRYYQFAQELPPSSRGSLLSVMALWSEHLRQKTHGLREVRTVIRAAPSSVSIRATVPTESPLSMKVVADGVATPLQANAPSSAGDQLVIVQGRRKFHRPGCPWLRGPGRRMRRTDAVQQGLSPCGTCWR